MEETLYTDLIAKYLSGNITEAERQTLWKWVEAELANRHFFDQMVQLWGMSENIAESEYATDTAQAWASLEQRLFGNAGITLDATPQPSNKIVRLSIKRAWMAAAAVILLAISVSVWLYRNPVAAAPPMIVETATQEKRLIELPDKSKVWLNENTKISYDPAFAVRVVELEGEAFFEVEKVAGKNFTILSGGAETVVLGTSFNVRAYPAEEKIEVTVATGKVALQDKNNETQKVLLEPGQSGVYIKETQEVEEVPQSISNADAWRTEQLNFNETPIEEVILSLERYFNVEMDIQNPAILNCRYNSTQTFQAPSLEEIIAGMEFSLDLKIEKQDNIYIIRGEGCGD